jgi:large subunit ribosomal protein L22
VVARQAHNLEVAGSNPAPGIRDGCQLPHGLGTELGSIMEYEAHHRFADMSARKIRPYAALIRGRRADEALEALRFFPNKSARLLEQVLKSALGNAEDRGARDIDDLLVAESRVDGGPMVKRIQPRARGSAYVIKRRWSHIHITLSDE